MVTLADAVPPDDLQATSERQDRLDLVRLLKRRLPTSGDREIQLLLGEFAHFSAALLSRHAFAGKNVRSKTQSQNIREEEAEEEQF